MELTSLPKGKERASSPSSPRRRSGSPSSYASSSSGSESEAGSDSESDSGKSSSDEEVTQEYLESLLEKARQNAKAAGSSKKSIPSRPVDDGEEEVIELEGGYKLKESPLPPLDPGKLPNAYIELSDSKRAGPSKIRDIDAERLENASPSTGVPDSSHIRPPELNKSGKPLTRMEKKELKNKTAGPAWYDLPAPDAADLPKLYREVEALRLRNQLDPKRFYRKDEGEGKGIKGLPKHFAIGTIIAEKTPFGTASSDNLSRSHRKRTLVDELVDDAESKSYAKKKFKELQTVRGARGRGTLAKKKSLRKPKW